MGVSCCGGVDVGVPPAVTNSDIVFFWCSFESSCSKSTIFEIFTCDGIVCVLIWLVSVFAVGGGAVTIWLVGIVDEIGREC